MILELNSRIPLDAWCELAFEHASTDSFITESIDQGVIDEVNEILAMSDENPSAGNEYIPVFIVVLGNELRIHDISGHCPPSANPKFLELVHRDNVELSFKREDGKTITFPYERAKKDTNGGLLSLMVTACFATADSYNQVAIIRTLKGKPWPPAYTQEMNLEGFPNAQTMTAVNQATKDGAGVAAHAAMDSDFAKAMSAKGPVGAVGTVKERRRW